MRRNGSRQLTYCLNVHPGETATAVLEAIRTHAVAVRRQVAPGQPFGLGLWLSAAAATELSDPARRDALRRLLDENDLYVFTLNGFPYGRFHGGPVKQRVYEPDWRQPERLAYTKQLAHLLAELLPEGMSGSISTVPGGYAAALQTADAEAVVARALVDCVTALHEIYEETGKEIHLGLEPEPDAWLETTPQTVRFLRHVMPRYTDDPARLQRHLGVCVDTCHVAMQFEDLSESLIAYRLAGVRISKVQISAALIGRDRTRLAPFDEPVYLHQARIRDTSGRVFRWPDLRPALEADWGGATEARVHYHVPLFWPGDEGLGTTAALLDDSFWRTLEASGCEHMEVETYTFDVLPAELRMKTVAESIARELQWTLRKMGDVYSDNRSATSA